MSVSPRARQVCVVRVNASRDSLAVSVQMPSQRGLLPVFPVSRDKNVLPRCHWHLTQEATAFFHVYI